MRGISVVWNRRPIQQDGQPQVAVFQEAPADLFPVQGVEAVRRKSSSWISCTVASRSNKDSGMMFALLGAWRHRSHTGVLLPVGWVYGAGGATTATRGSLSVWRFLDA